MNFLVTGGAGYVGYFVTKKLLERNHNVTVLDNLTYGKAALGGFIGRDRFDFILGDICDLKSVVRAAKGKDAVISLAAIVGDPACNLNPDETVSTNYLATKIMADVCAHYQIGRIIFPSSCSVYGDTGNSIADENFPVNPLSLYAETRVMSERFLLGNANQVSSVILRLATVFGYSERMRFDLVLNFLTARAYYRKNFSIYGGDQWRPLIHVQDAAEAFVSAALAEKEKVVGKIFNVGDDANNFTIEQVGHKVSQLVPGIKVEAKREIEDRRNYRVNFGKIKDELGFRCRFGIEDGIKELVRAFQENKIGNFEDEIYYNVKYIYKSRNS